MGSSVSHGRVNVIAVFVGACQSGGLNYFYLEIYMSRDVVVLSAVRSPIGAFGGNCRHCDGEWI